MKQYKKEGSSSNLAVFCLYSCHVSKEQKKLVQNSNIKFKMPKKSFALRINEKTMKAVELWAADEFRSINGQLEWMITKMLKEHNRLKVEKDNTANVPTKKT